MDKLPSKMLTCKEARKILGLSKSSFYRLLQHKELKYYQPITGCSYRIAEDDLKKFIEEAEVK